MDITIHFEKFMIVATPVGKAHAEGDYADYDIFSAPFKTLAEADKAAERWIKEEAEKQKGVGPVELRFAVMGYSSNLEGWRIFTTGHYGRAIFNGVPTDNGCIILGRGTPEILSGANIFHAPNIEPRDWTTFVDFQT